MGKAKVMDSNWIDVNERLPEEGQLVLIYFPSLNDSYGMRFGTWQASGLEFAKMRDEMFADATHWMPLPLPPTLKQSNISK